MNKSEIIEAQKKFGEAINSGNLERLRTLIAEDVVEHDPAPGQAHGAEGYIEFFNTLRSAFPDMEIKVETMVADDEKIAFAYTLTGTHEGDFNGIAATGKKIKARGMQISRFENGHMVERWGSSDELGILKQLGLQIAA